MTTSSNIDCEYNNVVTDGEKYENIMNHMVNYLKSQQVFINLHERHQLHNILMNHMQEHKSSYHVLHYERYINDKL